jgi:hypothetical protein
MAASKFKYQERSPEDVKKRATQSGSTYDSYLNDLVQFVKVEEGENNYRILPPTWDLKSDWGNNWCLDTWVHRNVGPDNGVYLCPAKMGALFDQDTACPICEAVAGMDEDEDEKAIKDLKAKQERLAYIIDRSAEKEGPKVWRLGWQLEKALQLRMQNKKTGAVLAIDDPDNGHDISFRREGKMLNTRYINEDIDRDPSPLHEKQSTQDKWMDFIVENPLPDMLIIHDYDYLDKIYRGKKGSKKDREEDAEEEKPTRSSRNRSSEEGEDDTEANTPRSARNHRSEPEPEDEPKPRGSRGRNNEDDNAEEETKEESPRRSRRGEEAEDETPRRGRRQEAEEEAPRSRRSRSEEPEPEDDPEPDPEEEKPRGRARASRDADPDSDDAVASTRARLQRLKPKAEEDDEPPRKVRRK